MITVVFSGNENVKNYITGLWQWDYGQTLRIQGLDLPTAVEIHFSLQETGGEAVTRIGVTKDGVTDVVIPDGMLENEDTEMDYNIYVFIYLTDEGSGETEKKITLKVKARPRPEAFDTPEDAELFREAIKEVNNAAGRAEGAEKNASEHAAQTRQDAEQTAEDRREIERIAETVSDIGEHVNAVREYKDQAQEAARNALQAKEEGVVAKEATIAAKNEAKKSEDTAKEYAEKAKKDADKTTSDRVEVERLVVTVSEVSEQVEAIKEYKDQAQSAATNALLAKNESKKAKEDALLAQTAAESAASAAEQHALDAAGDKRTVERLAAQVREDKDAVAQSKTSIEETVQGFDQTVQQAKESINTVAAEKVSAVQNAGTEAVQEVTTVKGEAVKAVEDKGVEQVQALGDKGKEIIESFPTAPDLDAKLDKQQGIENAGKALVIGEDGNVVTGEVQTSIEVDATLTQQGKAADAKAVGDKFLQFAIKNAANGKGVIHMKDSVEEKILDFKMQGKTEQETIENPNLFDLEKVLDINNWQDGYTPRPSYLFEIKVESGYRYSFDADTINWSAENQYSFHFSVSTKSDAPFAVAYNKSKAHVSPTAGSTGKVYIIVFAEITAEFLKELFEDKLSNIQIRKGASKLPYMPYTGGKKIPNPESSREIVNAGKKDEDIGKYTVDVKLTGKNILNEEELYDSRVWNNYLYEVKLKPDTKYTFSRLGSTGYQSGIFFSIEDTKEGTASQIINSNSSTMNKKQVVFTTNDTGIIKFKLSGVSAGRLKEFIGYAQLEEGGVATEYEPYKEQIVTLASNRFLTKWDKLEKRDGVWGWLFKTGTLNLADATVWSINDDGYTNNETHRIYTPIPDVVANSEAFCNKLYPFAAGDISGIKVADYECFNISNGNYLQMKLLKERGTTADELKAFFAESDIYVLYPTMNEEFVPLSDKEQNMLNNLHTYYPTTIISNSEDCDISIRYVADTKNYVDNKFLSLASKII